MNAEMRLPFLGENVDEGTVTRVLVKKGDTIAKDDPVIEVETGKAAVEVPSSVGGRVKEVRVKQGDKIKPDQVILVVESAAADKPASSSAESAPTPTRPRAKADSLSERTGKPARDETRDFELPFLGENISEATVTGVLVKEGDTVAKDDPVIEVETGKAAVEVPIPFGGQVRKIHVKAGAKLKVGQPVLSLRTSEPVSTPASPIESAPESRLEAVSPTTSRKDLSSEETPVPAVRIRRDRKLPLTTPTVRRFAREIGIDIFDVTGSGERGRVTLEDVKKHSRVLNAGRVAEGRPSASFAQVAATPLPDFAKWGRIERKEMSGVRKATMRHLAASWATIPHVTQCDKADVTNLENLRKKFSEKVEKHGAKLTITAILMKVVASALRTFPQFNASIDPGSEEVIYKKYFHIGVAVDTEHGLLVPVLRDVDRKNIIELAVELNTLAEKARTRKLAADDMQGGSFTISNLGGIGGSYFTPIINAPEVAILGVSRARMEQVYREGQFVPRLMMPLSLSYDHRLIDGADGARFLKWIIEALQQPFLISLEG